MVRQKGAAALARRGLWVSAAVLAAVWAPTIGAQPNLSIEQPAAVTGQWSLEAAGQLIQAIEGARAEGLNPRDYRVTELRRAAEQGPGPQLDAVANAAAASLAHDYYFGRARDREGWMIRRTADEEAGLSAQLGQAIASGQLRSFYAGLLPADPRYAALREALSETTDPVTRDRVRANMERWRWMPRTMGDSYIYVNVPSYQLQVIDGGSSVATYDVVVGAPKTPTPALASPASSLVVNPWWNVPQSIIKSSNIRAGRGGYVGSGKQVRQPPGPRNALGKIKFNLINDQAIYLHDTPAKAAFTREDRALSHGCIRVKDIDQLAFQLMGDGASDGRMDQALATTQTTTFRLPRTWQVYIVYFTMDGSAPGQLVSYDDPYGRDAGIIAQLDGRPVEYAGGGGKSVARR